MLKRVKMLAPHLEIINSRKWTVLPNATVIYNIIKIEF